MSKRVVSERCERCEGQAALVVVVTVVVAMAVLIGALVQLGASTGASARAQTAADAAALASLEGGRQAATRLAAANDGVLVSWRRGPGRYEVTVVVSVDGVTATARASNAP